jgi:uroporphyrinogen decarboxylase
MNSKERVRNALDFKSTDRPPFSATYVPEIESQLREIVGFDEFDLGVALGNDMVKTAVGFEMSYVESSAETYVCKWGCTWRNVKNSSGKYSEIIVNPLAGELSLLDSYEIPDPSEESQYNHCRKIVELYGDTKWIIGSCQCTIFEAAHYLRGMENFMMDLVLNPEYAKKLIEKVSVFAFEAARKFIELGVDMVWFGDDISSQNGMMMSMPMWREFFRPVYKELFAYCKSLNPNIKIAYHSCGNLSDAINDFIEIGLDVLNPIQPLSMNPQTIKEKFGSKLVLFGGLDVQKTLPFGTPEDVKKETAWLKEVCGKNGGYILNPAHHIQSDTSIANILAYYDEAKKTS